MRHNLDVYVVAGVGQARDDGPDDDAEDEELRHGRIRKAGGNHGRRGSSSTIMAERRVPTWGASVGSDVSRGCDNPGWCKVAWTCRLHVLDVIYEVHKGIRLGHSKLSTHAPQRFIINVIN